MNRTIRRVLCTALAVCLVFSLCAVPAFAEESLAPDEAGYPQFNTYTILGDSNGSGYGLVEHEAIAKSLGLAVADGHEVSTAYGYKVGQAVGAEKVNWNAYSGWRTTDFLRVVEYGGFEFGVELPNPYIEYFDKFGWCKEGMLFISAFSTMNRNYMDGGVALKTAIENSVDESDLISVQFGSNDIFTFMMMALIQKWGDIFGEITDGDNLFEALEAWINSIENCPEGERPTLLADIVNGCETGLSMFEANYPLILDYLTQKNPNAKIVVLGVINPVEDLLNFSQAIDFDIFTVSDYTCAKANYFLKNLCNQYENVIYVSATDVDGYGLPAVNWDKVLNGSGLDPTFAALKMVHPSEIGHAQIAERILDALCAWLKTPNVTVSTTSTLARIKLDWTSVPGAVSYRVYRSALKNGPYYLVNATCGNSYIDLATVTGVTYYYKVTAVMNNWGTVRTAASSASATAQSALKSLFAR